MVCGYYLMLGLLRAAAGGHRARLGAHAAFFGE
jgi:hypothetical protein